MALVSSGIKYCAFYPPISSAKTEAEQFRTLFLCVSVVTIIQFSYQFLCHTTLTLEGLTSKCNNFAILVIVNKSKRISYGVFISFVNYLHTHFYIWAPINRTKSKKLMRTCSSAAFGLIDRVTPTH
jgi:hypothetical protein